MARLLTNGAETQFPLTATASMDGEGEGFILVGAPTVATATPRSGAAYFSCAPSAANVVAAAVTTTLGRTYYLRAAIRFAATPNAALDIMQFRAGANLVGGIRLLSGTGTLKLVDSAGVVGANGPTLSTGVWYVIEVSCNVPAAGNGTLDYRVDGVAAAQGPQTSANMGNTAISTVRAGHGTVADTACTILVDDFALNDDQGASQNSWPGLGKVILLKPVADSAVGTGWQEADGTTNALWTNVDNTPPTGVASPTVDTQVKNASSGGPFNYDAAVTDYTTAGIQTGDTIVLTRMLARLSGSSTTGTNDGFGRVVSNPADAGDTTWTAAFDVVAGADTSAGSGWKTWITPYVYAPAVTKGTQPVIRVVKNTAATRIHMADLMVLEVEYLYLLGLGTSAAASTATLALTAQTGIPLGTSAAASTATLALTAQTTVALGASAGASTTSLDLTAPSTGVPVPLDASAGVSTATLSLLALTQVPLGTSAAASTTSLALSAQTAIPLGTSAATTSGALTLSATTTVVLGTSSAAGSATFALNAPTEVILGMSSATTSATLSVRIPTQVPLGASAGTASASLTIVFTPEVHLSTSAATSTATLALTVIPTLALGTSRGTSTAALTLSAETLILLSEVHGESGAGLDLSPVWVTLHSGGQAFASLSVKPGWSYLEEPGWTYDEDSGWTYDGTPGWSYDEDADWTYSGGTTWTYGG